MRSWLIAYTAICGTAGASLHPTSNSAVCRDSTINAMNSAKKGKSSSARGICPLCIAR